MPKKRARNETSSTSLRGRKRINQSLSTPVATRVSQRSFTIKKIALSKEKRLSNSRKKILNSKDRKLPWEESDDDCEAQLDYSSNSEFDSEYEDDKNCIKDEFLTDLSDEECKEKESITIQEESLEKILCPWSEFSEDCIPPLILPCSSSDLLVDKDHLFDALEIYEILRAYCHTIQISPFLFEDFCAALRSTNQSKILCEIHIALLRLLLRDDEDDQTLYSVPEINNSFNIMIQLLEPMTFAEVLRQYVESDQQFSQQILVILNTSNYPFVELGKRLKVLKWLCERFFETHDEHCRDCGRQGDVLLCDGCEACYHLQCANLMEIPKGKWLCQVCELHEINGVANCLLPGERDYRFTRRIQPIGYDRHQRIYWFLARRIFVQDVNQNEVHYYSSLPQVYELLSVFDANYMEKHLCKAIDQILPTINNHMQVTLEITEERKKNLQIKMQRESPFPYLHVDNIHRMSKIVADLIYNKKKKKLVGNNAITEENCEAIYNENTMEALKKFLGIENDHLVITTWSGGLTENELLDYYNRLENEYSLTNEKTNTNGNSTLEKLQLTLLENLQRGYRLGFSDAEYRNYVNQYSVNDFARSPYARAKDRDRRRYLCSKFSLCDESEFTWICAKNRDCFVSEQDVGRWIQFTLKRVIEKVSDELMHRLWKMSEKQKFFEYLQNCLTVDSLKYALLQFERAVRKPIFCNVWWNSLGHTKLVRLTSEERDRRQKIDAMKKKEEKALSVAELNDEDIVWVKYTRTNGPPKHALWRIKDEQYRLNGREELGGWLWISSTRCHKIVDFPSKTPLGITYLTLKTSLKSRESKKAFKLDKLIRCLSVRRHLNEVINAAKNCLLVCYSPSCRALVTKPRSALQVLSLHGNQSNFRPCYSPSCLRRFLEPYAFTTSCIVKASKTFRPNPYNLSTLNKPKSPEETLGEGKCFPYPKPYQYQNKEGKRSILILPTNSLRKLARLGGLNAATYIPGFHKQAKANFNVWPYPCVRPLFDNCWRYMTLNAVSLHSVALQLRIMYACIRWADLEPDKDDEDQRVWSHHADCDEVRTVIGHKEYPPDGYYEQYKIRVERYALDDSKISEDGDDDSADYKTTTVKTLRTKYKRKNQKGPKEIYVKRRRTDVFESWIDGVELKLFEIRDYWARYFYEKRQRIEQQKNNQNVLQRRVLNPNQLVIDSRKPINTILTSPRTVGQIVKIQPTQDVHYINSNGLNYARIIEPRNKVNREQILNYKSQYCLNNQLKTANGNTHYTPDHQYHLHSGPSSLNSSLQMSNFEHRLTPRTSGSSVIFNRNSRILNNYNSPNNSSIPPTRHVVVRRDYSFLNNSSEYYDQFGNKMQCVLQQKDSSKSKYYDGVMVIKDDNYMPLSDQQKKQQPMNYNQHQ